MMNLYRGSASLPSSSWNASCASRRFVDLDLQQRPGLRVERRLRQHPERHLAQPLEPRDVRLRVRLQPGQDLLLVLVVLRPVRLLADVDAVQRRLRDVDVPLLISSGHVPQEEVEQQRA